MFTVKMKTDNDAFADGNAAAEVARILRRIGERLESGERDGACMDANGNRVGTWALTGVKS